MPAFHVHGVGQLNMAMLAHGGWSLKTMPCVPPPLVCSKEECPKNHIVHMEEDQVASDGTIITIQGAKLHLEHHKNERKQGPAIIPLPSSFVGVLSLMEKASKHLAPECPTLLCTQSGEPLSGPHMSIVAKRLLSNGKTQCTATDMRHEFTTNWRDFMDSSSGQVESLLTGQVEGAASFMMGNSPAAWDATYDDNIRSRAKERVLKLYPKFQEFVKAEGQKRKQMRLRDPTA